MSSITGILVATSMVLGQAEQPSAYEHLKGLRWLVGDMVGEYTVQKGWDEFAPVGTKVTRRISVRWGLNKSILQAKVTTIFEGQPPVTSIEIAGWDPKSKQIVHWILSPGGGSGSGVWSQEGDEWLLKWTSVTPGGTTFAGTSRMHATGPDTSVWRVVNATKDGNKIADIPTVEFKKADIAEASELPEQRLEFLNGLVGEWTMEGTSRGDQVTAEIEIDWAGNLHCLEYRGTWNVPDGRASFSGLAGWDPAKKAVVFTEYWSGGGQNTLRYPAGTATVLEGTMAGVDDEGRPTGGEARLAITGPDEFVFTAKKAFRGDEPQPDTKLVFRRR